MALSMGGSVGLVPGRPKLRLIVCYASPGASTGALRSTGKPDESTVTAPRAVPSNSCRYAILNVGGVRQVVEEGHDYACLSKYVQAVRINNDSNNAMFHSVLGIRSDGQFTWGKPFVPHAAVEVELLDEFQGPVPATAAEVPVDSVMTRYRVKHIIASNDTVN